MSLPRSKQEKMLRKFRPTERGRKSKTSASKEKNMKDLVTPKRRGNYDPNITPKPGKENAMKEAISFLTANFGKSPQNIDFAGQDPEVLGALCEHMLAVSLGGWTEEEHYFTNPSGRTASKDHYVLKEGHLYAKSTDKPAFSNADWLYSMREHIQELTISTRIEGNPLFEQEEQSAFEQGMQQAEGQELTKKKQQQRLARQQKMERDKIHRMRRREAGKIEKAFEQGEEPEKIDRPLPDMDWSDVPKDMWESFTFQEKLSIILEGTPEKVKEIADAIKQDNPDISDEKKFKFAWATYKKQKK